MQEGTRLLNAASSHPLRPQGLNSFLSPMLLGILYNYCDTDLSGVVLCDWALPLLEFSPVVNGNIVHSSARSSSFMGKKIIIRTSSHFNKYLKQPIRTYLVQMISKQERNSGYGNEHGAQSEARTPKPMCSCYKQARDLSLLTSSHQLGKTISYAVHNTCKYETVQKKPALLTKNPTVI